MMKNTPTSEGSRRQRKRAQTADHISATAFRLFEKHGYDVVAMEQIADEADVAKATLYNYFPVKEALIAHRFREDIVAGMTERAAALVARRTFEARMRYLLRESAAWHTARKPYLPHYLRYLTSQARYNDETSHEKTSDSGSRQILTQMFEAAQRSGEVDTRQTAAHIAWSFEYLLFGAVAAWLVDPSTDLTKRFLAAFDLAMHGMAINPRVKRSRLPTKGAK
ncbi:MAG: helix-turn-helix domain-containing protein [Dokdonella sp.]